MFLLLNNKSKTGIMLLLMLSNLNMYGTPVPPTPTKHPSGSELEFGEGGGGIKKELPQAGKKIIQQDEEDVFLFITNWLIQRNQN